LDRHVNGSATGPGQVLVGRGRPVLVVLGEGGHTTELLRLVDQLDTDHDIHYVVPLEDPLSARRIRRPGPVHRLPRPRAKDAGVVEAAWATGRALLGALRLVRRLRPVAVLSTGPAIAVPVSLAARMHGAEIVFIETVSRVTTVSGTGRIMRRVADTYFVQWPELAERLPGSIYAGRLL
jgi:beta-1,4-N-acetylglucosaminyltransferase